MADGSKPRPGASRRKGWFSRSVWGKVVRVSAEAAFKWRPLVPADARNWSGLLADLEAVDGGWVYYSEQVLVEDFADPDTDYDRGSVAVCDAESLTGYGVLTSHPLVDQAHEMRFDGGVHPDYRRRGIGGALLEWAERAAVPIHLDRFPGRPLSLSATCMSTNESAIAMFSAYGYEPVRWFHAMVRDLSKRVPAGSGPAGVRIVELGPEQLEDARTVRNEAFRDHWGSTEQTAESWAHFMAFGGFLPQFSFVAYARDEPVGIIISHEYEQPVEVAGARELYVAVVATRRAARNQGIASALLTRVLTDAASAGFTTASLGVDADSMTGAVGLYERAGFAVHHSTITHTKTLP
jgi:mycothiol synthase